MLNRLIKARLFLSVSRAAEQCACANAYSKTLRYDDLCSAHSRHESDASLCVAETPLLHLRSLHQAKGRSFTTSKPNVCTLSPRYRSASLRRINKTREKKRTNNKLSDGFFSVSFFSSFLVVNFQSSRMHIRNQSIPHIRILVCTLTHTHVHSLFTFNNRNRT